MLVLLVLNGRHVDGGLVREEKTTLYEPLVTRIQDGVKHRLVEQKVAHPFGDDDVHLIDRERNFLNLALDDGHHCRQSGLRLRGKIL